MYKHDSNKKWTSLTLIILHFSYQCCQHNSANFQYSEARGNYLRPCNRGAAPIKLKQGGGFECAKN